MRLSFNNPVTFSDPTGADPLGTFDNLQDLIDYLWRTTGTYGGYWDSNGTFGTFGNNWDAFGHYSDMLDQTKGWGITTAGSFDKALDNFIHNRAADDGKQIALRTVDIQETYSNSNWLIDRQKEAWGNTDNTPNANQGGQPTINVVYGGGGIRSTSEALSIYYNGNGSPQVIAGNVIQDLVRSKAFQFHNNNILSGHTSKTGSFSVDLTWTGNDFFVGRTNVNYSISISGGNAIVTFNMFVNDGFWDPNFIGEKFVKPDGMGPNLETPGGHPYPFIPVTGTETFPNPGYH